MTCAVPQPCDEADAGMPDERPKVTYHEYILRADTLLINTPKDEVSANCNVELHGPDGVFTAESALFRPTAQTGYLDDVAGYIKPFHFTAHSLSLDEKQVKHLQSASLTTCEKTDHPHFQMTAKDFIVYPDDRFLARKLALKVSKYTLFSIPRIKGTLSGQRATIDKPTFMPGYHALDGAYMNFSYGMPLGPDTDLTLETRYGTKKLFRGGLSLEHNFALGEYSGVVRLVADRHQDVIGRTLQTGANRDSNYDELTVNHLPALQVTMDPIRLGNDGMQLKLGGSVGRYREDPVGVTANRAAGWAVLRSPSFGGRTLQFHAEYGVQRALYGGPDYTGQVGILTLETPINHPDYYFNISLVRRWSSGQTPFLFDRTQPPRELYLEAEVPVTSNKKWRIGLSNRHNLLNGQSSDFAVSAIYRQDCISYGLTYDRASQSFGLGLVLNAFGSFRKGSTELGFMQ
jgi:hypothetical protein